MGDDAERIVGPPADEDGPGPVPSEEASQFYDCLDPA